MKTIFRTKSHSRCLQSPFHCSAATLAEMFWFVSSFVLSIAMGPFTAVPAIIAVFSLKPADSPMPHALEQYL